MSRLETREQKLAAAKEKINKYKINRTTKALNSAVSASSFSNADDLHSITFSNSPDENYELDSLVLTKGFDLKQIPENGFWLNEKVFLGLIVGK
jgi:hypothetical protein